MIAGGEFHQPHVVNFVEYILEQWQQDHGERSDQPARDQRKHQHNRNFRIGRAAGENENQRHRSSLDGGHRGTDHKQILAMAATPRTDTGNQDTDQIVGGEPAPAVGVIGHKQG